MNILIVSNLIGATSVGGMFIQIQNTAKFLSEKKLNVTLHNPFEKIEKNKFDAIHIFGANISTYHFVNELHKKNIPFFLSPIFFSTHSTRKLKLALTSQKIFQKILSGTFNDIGIVNQMCKMAKAILPNTNEEKKLIQNSFNIEEEKIVVIPNGVDKNFANGNPEEFEKQFAVKNFVLNVGYFGKRKNTLKQLNIASKMDLQFVFIGESFDDNYSYECKKIISNSKNILHINKLENNSELLKSAYFSAKVFCLPSLFETPGIAALEAAICGTNIAITKHGGTKEYFLNYAEYIEPKSEEAIRNAIEKSFQKEKSENLKIHILENYTWKKIAQTTIDAYKKFL